MRTFIAIRAIAARTAAIMLVFALTLLSGCASAPPDRLYQDLGGQRGIETIVDHLLDNIAADDRIFPQFEATNIDRFRQMLIEQFCSISGGPCAYTGDSMEKSHGGKYITEAHFNALVEDLYRAMEKAGTPVGAQNRLVALLAPMRPEIINQ